MREEWIQFYVLILIGQDLLDHQDYFCFFSISEDSWGRHVKTLNYSNKHYIFKRFSVLNAIFKDKIGGLTRRPHGAYKSELHFLLCLHDKSQRLKAKEEIGDILYSPCQAKSVNLFKI